MHMIMKNAKALRNDFYGGGSIKSVVTTISLSRAVQYLGSIASNQVDCAAKEYRRKAAV